MRRILVGLVVFLCGVLHAEKLHIVGDYSTIGTVDGDLIVIGGSINIPAAGGVDFVVNGDLKVNGGNISISGGDLIVDGDLIITNTLPAISTPDASIEVVGNIKVSGAIITKSDNGNAHIYAEDPATSDVGSIIAGRISTNGGVDAYVMSDHHITVTGSIVTKGTVGSAFVKSYGKSSIYGNIFAASILTYAPDGDGFVHVENGNLIVNGPVITEAANNAYIFTEGNIEVDSISVHSTDEHATVTGERIRVLGDIRTLADTAGKDALVMTRQAAVVAQQERIEDIFAHNIYTKSDRNSYVKGHRSIDVKGDIATWQLGATGDGGILTTNFDIIAQNLITYAADDGYVQAARNLTAAEDVIAEATAAGTISVEAVAGSLAAENISMNGQAPFSNIGTGLNLSGVCRLRGTGAACNIIVSSGELSARKIFIECDTGNLDADASADSTITVTGPIVLNTSSGGNVTAGSNINAQSIFVTGDYLRSVNGSIIVDEDIRVENAGGSAYVRASSGNITARSVKTDASIQSAAGTGEFQLSVNKESPALVIKDAQFDFDHDYDWPVLLSLEGTCTINGRGNQLNFNTGGRISIGSDTSLYLQNLKINNIGDDMIKLTDNTSTLSLHNVIWTQTADYAFDVGDLHIVGDLYMSGPGTKFIYSSSLTSSIHSNATWLFDKSTTLSFDSTNPYGISMEDGSSRLAFDGSTLHGVNDIRLISGTLAFDNLVSFTAEDGKSIYFGDGDIGNNLSLEFHGATQLTFTRVENQNA